jgi:cytochrome c biogenesis protein CcmG, thiol:disulfide interchange protein DsbE
MKQKASKTTMRKIMSGVTLGAVAGLLIIFAAPSYNHGEASVAGSKAKPFSFELNGKQMQLSDFRGRVVVLNFWATWCPPCVDETQSLIALQKEIAPKNATILGISIDDDAQAYQQFLQAHKIDFPTFRDPSEKIASEYGTHMWPESYIIGRDGRILRKLIGEQDWMSPEMTAYFNSLFQNN